MTARLYFPEFEVAVGSMKLKSGGRAALWRLEILREVNGGADEAVFQLGISGDFSARTGDDVTVDLGYSGSLERVFTGTVDRLIRGLQSIEVMAVGGQGDLMRKRSDRGFVNQKAGEVWQTLVDEAGATTARSESGVAMPSYLVDSSKTYWEHGLELGFHSGNDLYSNVQGEIVFAPINADAPPLKLKFGADLLQAACQSEPAPPKIIHIPESPASSSGEETAAWFAKDSTQHQGEAGDGDGAPQYFPVLRTQEQAQASAQCRSDRLTRAATIAEVELIGTPAVELGDPVELKDLPAGGDGTYVVLALRHVVGPDFGFRTYAALGGVP